MNNEPTNESCADEAYITDSANRLIDVCWFGDLKLRL